MGSCGTPPMCRELEERAGKAADASSAGSVKLHSWAASMLCLACLAVVLGGCVPLTITFGSLPNTERLANLELGVSTTSDIVQALGEPRGRGSAGFAFNPTPRTILFYEYAEAGVLSGEMRLKMLLVFINEERYEGHLWFTSVEQLKSAD